VQGQATAQLQLSNQSPVMCQLGISVMRISKPKRPIVLKKVSTSFDHLVGCNEQLVGDVEAEHPGALVIDDQFQLGRL